MHTLRIIQAGWADLAAIERIENRCFDAARRSSRRSLARSLRSPRQSVWVAVVGSGGEPRMEAAMVLRHHRHSTRIFSLAVLPACRGKGTGGRLVRKACILARRAGHVFVSLEADARNRKRIDWYRSFGFEGREKLKDYYAPGRDALRMRRRLVPAGGGNGRGRP